MPQLEIWEEFESLSYSSFWMKINVRYDLTSLLLVTTCVCLPLLPLLFLSSCHFLSSSLCHLLLYLLPLPPPHLLSSTARRRGEAPRPVPHLLPCLHPGPHQGEPRHLQGGAGGPGGAKGEVHHTQLYLLPLRRPALVAGHSHWWPWGDPGNCHHQHWDPQQVHGVAWLASVCSPPSHRQQENSRTGICHHRKIDKVIETYVKRL